MYSIENDPEVFETYSIEYYRKLLAEYEIDVNDPEAFEDIMCASEERLIIYAIRDAIKYWKDLKRRNYE